MRVEVEVAKESILNLMGLAGCGNFVEACLVGYSTKKGSVCASTVVAYLKEQAEAYVQP